MALRNVFRDVSLTLAAVVLASAALGGTLAVADDLSRRDVLPLGTRVAGVDLGDTPPAEARLRIGKDVAGPLLAPVSVDASSTTRRLEPGPLLHVDVDGMIERALLPPRRLSLAERVWARVTGGETGTTVPVLVTTDAKRIGEWVDDLSSEVDARALDATLTVEGSAVRISPSRTGRRLRREEAASALRGTLLEGGKDVTLPVDPVEPKVREDSFGKTVVVRLSERRLYLYDGDDLEKSYGVAVGTPGFPTPTGWFEIVLKRYMPTWSNPGSDWAKGMPRTIPPGPGNPLGTRALNLNAPGIRIHGTSIDSSIGTAASHGCMRMHRWDIEDLYERVEVGTRVVIVR